MVGFFARSVAGHDKDMVYVILASDEKNYFLVDGKTRKINMPKKKRKKHVQLIKNKRLDMDKDSLSDEEIKRAIKLMSTVPV